MFVYQNTKCIRTDLLGIGHVPPPPSYGLLQNCVSVGYDKNFVL